MAAAIGAFWCKSGAKNDQLGSKCAVKNTVCYNAGSKTDPGHDQKEE